MRIKINDIEYNSNNDNVAIMLTNAEKFWLINFLTRINIKDNECVAFEFNAQRKGIIPSMLS